MLAEARATDPIGTFDSGVGGLTVVREIQKLLPGEDIVYYADTANFPYGTKEPEQIVELAFAATRFLLSKRAKIVVVACNTASVALAALRDHFSVPFVGMVPAIKPASAATKRRKVGVIATEATVQGHVFAELVSQFATGVSVVTQACSELVELVERGEVASPRTREVVRRCLEPMMAECIDTLVLGCTHYPFLRPLIEEMLGEEITIIDTGEPVARQVARVAQGHKLLCRREAGGVVEYFTSGDKAAFLQVVQRLMG